MFDFQKLEVYKKAKEFHLLSREILKEKQIEKFAADQLLRASFSIALNIAEGSGRFSKPDRRNFFVIARGSVFECIAISDILNDQKKIPTILLEKFSSHADELSRILYSMIKNLSAE